MSTIVHSHNELQQYIQSSKDVIDSTKLNYQILGYVDLIYKPQTRKINPGSPSFKSSLCNPLYRTLRPPSEPRRHSYGVARVQCEVLLVPTTLTRRLSTLQCLALSWLPLVLVDGCLLTLCLKAHLLKSCPMVRTDGVLCCLCRGYHHDFVALFPPCFREKCSTGPPVWNA